MLTLQLLCKHFARMWRELSNDYIIASHFCKLLYIGYISQPGKITGKSQFK